MSASRAQGLRGCAAAVVLALLLPVPGVTQTSAEIEQTARSLQSDLEVQRRLPSDREPAPQGSRPGRGQQPSGESSPDSPWDSSPDSPSPGAGIPWGGWASLDKVLVWMGVFCGLALLASYVSESLLAWRQRIQSGGSELESIEAGTASPSPRTGSGILTEADVLAAQGQYADAMHLLLMAALSALRRRPDVEMRSSQTSRELLRTLSLGAAERDALQKIIVSVELAWFGEKPSGALDYASVRESFQRLDPAAGSREPG
jgi:hypothetical protein